MIKKLLSLTLVLFLVHQSVIGQNSQTFFQIVNTTDLVKLTYDSEKVEFETLDFNVSEPIHLLSYDQESSLLIAVTHHNNRLLKINQEGKIVSNEVMRGLPPYMVESFVISTMDDKGNMYLGGIQKKVWFKYNLKTKRMSRVHFYQKMPTIYDAAFDKTSNSLLSITQSGKLVRFEIDTRSVIQMDVNFPEGPYGSVWIDENNVIYGFNNATSKIFKYDASNKLKGQAIEVCDAPYKSKFNDGAAVIRMDEIKEITKEASEFAGELFVLYPNPNDGNFTVSFSEEVPKNSTIKIYDLNGRLVHKQKYPKGSRDSHLDLRHKLSTGGYVVSLEHKNGLLGTKRLIVQ